MFLNTGLLMTLDTPNQITGVMAHENRPYGAWIDTAAQG